MSIPKLILLVLLAAFFVFAGIAHFRTPEFYLPLMPDYLPWHLALIYISGAAEIALGVAVLIPRLRVMAAWGLIALLIAVFPANIHAAVNEVSVAGADPFYSWVRLPFQALFILWAWWYTRPNKVHHATT